MYGDYLHLLLVFALGASNLIGIGLVIAARLRTEEMVRRPEPGSRGR